MPQSPPRRQSRPLRALCAVARRQKTSGMARQSPVRMSSPARSIYKAGKSGIAARPPSARKKRKSEPQARVRKKFPKQTQIPHHRLNFLIRQASRRERWRTAPAKPTSRGKDECACFLAVRSNFIQEYCIPSSRKSAPATGRREPDLLSVTQGEQSVQYRYQTCHLSALGQARPSDSPSSRRMRN